MYAWGGMQKGAVADALVRGMVRHVGFEPTTLGLEVPCSIQLS